MNQVDNADRAPTEYGLPPKGPVAGRQAPECQLQDDREFRVRFVAALVQGARIPQPDASVDTGATA